LLVFVEVKARHNLDDAADSVTPRQRQRIAAAAEAWLATYPDESIKDIRFDAILVAPTRSRRSRRESYALSRSKNSSTCARMRPATWPRSSATCFTVPALERVSCVA
jgi:Holliday junction resolvase-like predicted endonuclease